LLFGATGVIGKYILAALLEASPPFSKVGIFTSANTASTKGDAIKALEQKGATIHIGDIKSESDVVAAYAAGYDTVVSALGRNTIADQIPLIELAEKTETIKKFFPSEFGTDIEYGPQSKDEKPHQQKLKVRKYIREHVKRLEYSFIVTGPFADGFIGAPRGESRAGGFDVKAKKAILLGTGEEKVSLTTQIDVGLLTVAALRHPVEAKNKALIVNSFTTTYNEILKEYETQTGKKWDVQYTSLDDLKTIEAEGWEKVGVQATGVTLRRIWAEGGTLYDHRDDEKIGFTNPQTLSDAVSLAIKLQTT